MFENISYDKIRERMLSQISDKLDKREGSVISDAVSPAAMELMAVYIELERIVNEAYGDTASRKFLILRCKERGITPFPATCAVLRGEFSPVDIDVTGKRFSLGELNYTVTEKISDGVFQLQCETAGRAGNQSLGSLIPIDDVDGLESAELTALLIPGSDEEGTEELRERYFSSFNIRAFGGNKADYLEKIAAIAGVGGVKVTPVWNMGVRPAELIPSQSVSQWFEANSETLPDDVSAWLTPTLSAAKSGKLTSGGCVLVTLLDSEFNTASEALVSLVKETLDPSDSTGEGLGIIPIGHVVTVQSALGIPVNVKTSLAFDSGYSMDNLQSLIEKAVADYLLELRKDWENTTSTIVRISQLETRILGIKGVADIMDTTINGAASNLALGEYEVPVFGTVSEVTGDE